MKKGRYMYNILLFNLNVFVFNKVDLLRKIQPLLNHLQLSTADT